MGLVDSLQKAAQNNGVLKILSEISLAGNELWRIIVLFLIIVLSLIAGKVAKYLFQRGADLYEKKHSKIFAVALSSISRSSTFLLFTLGLKAGINVLVMNSVIQSIVVTTTTILVITAIGLVIYNLVDIVEIWLDRFSQKTASKLDDMLVPLVVKSLRVTVVILILLQVAQTLSDKPITSIIAGLGVGGLAVALAAQDTIKNFFGSLVLFSDKPFEVGDRITVEGYDGPVEEVGFRSTRIRTLDGHMVTIPNGQLANMTIHNIGKRPFIKRVMTVTVTYDTTPEKLQKALDILNDILDNHEGMDPELPPRIYFSDFASTSLDILVIYWYHPPDYWKFMDFSQKVNFEILERFNAEGIDFAFPTQTVYLAGDPSRPFNVGTYSGGNRLSPDKKDEQN
ncbi:MAG TPA: mechanosensitive ion channel family protein [Balneolales bacterium]|nr:mechanosensitive ion channel family protein [Balneolales bacterium]